MKAVRRSITRFDSRIRRRMVIGLLRVRSKATSQSRGTMERDGIKSPTLTQKHWQDMRLQVPVVPWRSVLPRDSYSTRKTNPNKIRRRQRNRVVVTEQERNKVVIRNKTIE